MKSPAQECVLWDLYSWWMRDKTQGIEQCVYIWNQILCVCSDTCIVDEWETKLCIFCVLREWNILYIYSQILCMCSIPVFTSLAKGGYVFGGVCLSVRLSSCLSVCGQYYSTNYERIGMKFYGGVLVDPMKNWLNFGSDLAILRWVNEQTTTIIAVA